MRTASRRGTTAGWVAIAVLFPFYVGREFGTPLEALAFGVGLSAVFGIARVLSLAWLVVLLTLRTASRAAA